MIPNTNEKLIPLNKVIFNKNLFHKCKLHEICSYIAMYPPKLVNTLIRAYTKESDLIYDPFSGRGTTLLEARLLNRRAYASDLNPLSYVITKSKTHSLDKNKIFSRIKHLGKEYCTSKISINKNDYDYMKTYFSDSVYKQLCFLKEALGKNWKTLNDVDTFILACLLGILHGPSRKDGTSLFLSISMSNTNSMSKNYVDNYVRKHHLVFPKNENIFEKLREKVEKSFSDFQLYSNKEYPIGNIKLCNALDCHKNFDDTKFDCIITSPPYLNIFNYTRENWIRLWLLGYDKPNLNKKIKLDDNHSYEGYKTFITNFMDSAHKALKKDGKLIMIVGDVENKYKFLNLWDEVKNNVKFKLVDSCKDERANNKSTRKNGVKSGKATKVDNVCLFRKK